jgi:hypothetical protein
MSRPSRIPPEAVERLIADTEPWLSCDDCFDGIDVVVEGVLDRTQPMSTAFRAHLGACSVCWEEATSLVTLVADEHGLAPEAAVELLEAVVHG